MPYLSACRISASSSRNWQCSATGSCALSPSRLAWTRIPNSIVVPDVDQPIARRLLHRIAIGAGQMAAIDQQLGTRAVRALVRGEEQHGVGDFLDLGHALD